MSMKEGSPIKSVEIDIGGTQLKLNVADAKRLYEALAELFEEKVVERIVRENYPYPVYPWRWHWREPYWCSTTDSKIAASYRANSQTLCLSAK